MSNDAPGPRPRQVTIGGWVIAVASAVLVVTVFDTMAKLNSVDTREALTEALTTGWARDLGLSVDDALTLVRSALYVSGVSAAVTGVLGIFVLQRHTAARLVLSVAAVPVVLTAPFAGGILGILIGGSTALLWTQAARDWFAGRPAAQREQPAPLSWKQPVHDRSGDRPDAADRPAPVAAPTPPSQPPPAQLPPAQLPPPTHGWGQPRPDQPGATPPPPPAYGQQPPVRSYPPPAPPQASAGSDRMPTEVRVACILTWIFSGLTASVYLMLIVGVAVDRNGLLDLMRDNPSIRDTSLSDDQLVGLLIAVSAFVIAWCLVACVVAVLTWRRHNAARVALLVSVGVAVTIEVLGLPYSLLHLAACAAAFVMLLREPTRAWFRRADQARASAPPSRDWPPPDAGSQPPPPAQYPPPPPPERPSGKPPVW